LIDAMTLAEAGEIFAYWAENPPAHLALQTIARLLGWKPREAGPDPSSIAAIAAAAPPGLVVTRNGGLGMPAALDLDDLRARNRARAVAVARRNRTTAGG
jgi:hypothetical protein